MRNLTVYEPREFDFFRLDDDLNQIFDTFLDAKDTPVESFAPVADIIEEDEKYLIKAEIPGVKQDEIKVTVDDGVLTLKGEKKVEKEFKDKHAHRIERSWGTFFRQFNLPKGADRDKIEAVYKDGVLEISLAKTKEAVPKEVEIHIN